MSLCCALKKKKKKVCLTVSQMTKIPVGSPLHLSSDWVHTSVCFHSKLTEPVLHRKSKWGCVCYLFTQDFTAGNTKIQFQSGNLFRAIIIGEEAAWGKDGETTIALMMQIYFLRIWIKVKKCNRGKCICICNFEAVSWMGSLNNLYCNILWLF